MYFIFIEVQLNSIQWVSSYVSN